MGKLKNKKLISFICVLTMIILIVLINPNLQINNFICSLSVKAKPSINYVALGDSISTGYGLSEYTCGITPENSYVNLIKLNLSNYNSGESVNLNNLSVDGLSSTELLESLKTTSKYEATLNQCDIVTLSIGSNDIFEPFLSIVAESFDIDIFNDENITGNIQSAITNRFNTNPALLIYTLVTLNSTLTKNETLNTACSEFSTNFAEIIDIIKEQAPDAKIYVTNAYNPYYGVKFINPITNSTILDLSTIVDGYINKINTAFSFTTPYYSLIDVNSAFKHSASSKTSLVNVSFASLSKLSTINFDPHPNAKGHEKISNLISSAYKSKLDTKSPKTNPNSTKSIPILISITAISAFSVIIISIKYNNRKKK